MSRKADLPPREALVAEYRAGTTLYKLGDKYGCSYTAVWRRMQKKPRVRKPVKAAKIPGRYEQITSLRAGGKGWREIGQALGITRQGASDYYHRHKRANLR